jgi:hypothetical protein
VHESDLVDHGTPVATRSACRSDPIDDGCDLDANERLVVDERGGDGFECWAVLG